MYSYEITLWRYPDESREPNAVGISVFYFKEIAKNKETAIAQAKERFEHSVYDSSAELILNS